MHVKLVKRFYLRSFFLLLSSVSIWHDWWNVYILLKLGIVCKCIQYLGPLWILWPLDGPLPTWTTAVYCVLIIISKNSSAALSTCTLFFRFRMNSLLLSVLSELCFKSRHTSLSRVFREIHQVESKVIAVVSRGTRLMRSVRVWVLQLLDTGV